MTKGPTRILIKCPQYSCLSSQSLEMYRRDQPPTNYGNSLFSATVQDQGWEEVSNLWRKWENGWKWLEMVENAMGLTCTSTNAIICVTFPFSPLELSMSTFATSLQRSRWGTDRSFANRLWPNSPLSCSLTFQICLLTVCRAVQWVVHRQHPWSITCPAMRSSRIYAAQEP